jgi:anti-sigma-K factor RskA
VQLDDDQLRLWRGIRAALAIYAVAALVFGGLYLLARFIAG